MIAAPLVAGCGGEKRTDAASVGEPVGDAGPAPAEQVCTVGATKIFNVVITFDGAAAQSGCDEWIAAEPVRLADRAHWTRRSDTAPLDGAELRRVCAVQEPTTGLMAYVEDTGTAGYGESTCNELDRHGWREVLP